MSTFNFTSTTNNVNTVLYSWSTRLTFDTDRKTSSSARGAVVRSVNNLGVGVAVGKPFTLMA